MTLNFFLVPQEKHYLILAPQQLFADMSLAQHSPSLSKFSSSLLLSVAGLSQPLFILQVWLVQNFLEFEFHY